MRHRNVVKDVIVYNTPGIAFFSYGNHNKVYRCRVENAGYIDVKFGAMHYAGARDRWSGDGFYFRGTGDGALDLVTVNRGGDLSVRLNRVMKHSRPSGGTIWKHNSTRW